MFRVFQFTSICLYFAAWRLLVTYLGTSFQVIKALLENSRKNSWAEVVHCKLVSMLANIFYQVPEEASMATSSPVFLVEQIDLIGGIEFIFLEVCFSCFWKVESIGFLMSLRMWKFCSPTEQWGSISWYICVPCVWFLRVKSTCLHFIRKYAKLYYFYAKILTFVLTVSSVYFFHFGRSYKFDVHIFFK